MTDVLVWLLIILPPVDWLAAAVIGSVSRKHPHILSLRERAGVAIAIAVAASLGGVGAWVYLEFIDLPTDALILVIALALAIVSLPSVVWMVMLLTGRFRLPEDPQ